MTVILPLSFKNKCCSRMCTLLLHNQHGNILTLFISLPADLANSTMPQPVMATKDIYTWVCKCRKKTLSCLHSPKGKRAAPWTWRVLSAGWHWSGILRQAWKTGDIILSLDLRVKFLLYDNSNANVCLLYLLSRHPYWQLREISTSQQNTTHPKAVG